MNIFKVDSKKDREYIFAPIFLGILLFSAVLISQFYSGVALTVVVGVFLVLALSIRLEWGLYLMAFFLPVINWHFSFYKLEVPLIDLIALLVLTAFVVRTVYNSLFTENKISIFWPIFWPFSFFFLIAVIFSFLSANIIGSFWYSVRWLLFPYLAYIDVL